MSVAEQIAHIERQIVKMKATIKGLAAKLALAKQHAAQLRGKQPEQKNGRNNHQRQA